MINIIVGGILSLPGLLLHVVTAPVIALLSAPAMIFLVYSKPKLAKKALSTDSLSKRVIVTGGSSGIGKSIAVAAAKQGIAEVVIIARNKERLEEARKEIVQANSSIVVKALSVDVGRPESLAEAAKEICTQDQKPPKTTHLFCCAGAAYPQYFQDIPPEEFSKAVHTNQLGSIFTAQAFVPLMTSGSVTFCSSGAGQIGVFGLASYSPTKFALRGYAECLHIELCESPIYVQVAYPPDTDTPGFAEENKTKPYETKKISEMAGLANPEDIGGTMLKEALKENPPFNVYFGLEGWLVTTLTCGFQPVSTVLDAMAQVSIMSVTRWISLFILNDWYNMIRTYKRGKANNASSKHD
jgi:3-dehydrosphinganine reductase